MAPEETELNHDYWVFPRENYQRLEEGLEGSTIKYDIADNDDDLIYLELKGNTPRSLQEFFVDLHGERLNSRKALENRMYAGEFVGSISAEDMEEIRNRSLE